MQRRTWLVPLLRQQVQFLAVDDRPAAAVLHAAAGDAQGWQPSLAGQSLSGLHQGGSVDSGERQRRRAVSPRQAAIIDGQRCSCLTFPLSIREVAVSLLNLFRLELR